MHGSFLIYWWLEKTRTVNFWVFQQNSFKHIGDSDNAQVASFRQPAAGSIETAALPAEAGGGRMYPDYLSQANPIRLSILWCAQAVLPNV